MSKLIKDIKTNPKPMFYACVLESLRKIAFKCGYAYIINDGIYIEIEGNICPATKFFQLIELIGNDMIDEYTFKSNCI